MAWIALFIETVGDRPITNYDKEDARTFKSTLLGLPANWRKLPETRDLTPSEAVEQARALGLPPMSLTDVNKAIGRLSTFWTYAESHYDNVSQGLFKSLKVSQNTSPRDQRHPFSLEQLNKLFCSPIYTGCRSERMCSQPGTHDMRNTARFWLPLLGLFSGARLNEICQMTVEDVVIDGPVPFLNISNQGEDQRTKSVSSNRPVPIHNRLIETGFIDFVRTRRSGHPGQLFQELKLDTAGYYSGEFSKFFSRYLDRIGAKTRKTSFHSFRHNFEDACRNGGVAPNLMNALQGHTEKGMAARYGSGEYRLEKLKDAVMRVTYPGLKFAGS